MDDELTTVGLIIVTAVSLAVLATAWLGLRRSVQAQRWLIILTAAGCSGLFLHRWLLVNDGLQPVQAHVDGLLLIAALLGWMVLYLDVRMRLCGLITFASPVLAIVLLWAICASLWTLRPFEIHSMLEAVHSIGVYGGGVFVCVAAVGGVMYLVSQRRLRSKALDDEAGKLPSLEATESMMIRTSAFGFALLTVGVITGLAIVSSSESTRLGEGWWHQPKVLGAVMVWVIFAMIMNVRRSSRFRGARAAWLAICGLFLLLAVFGVVNRLGASAATGEAPGPAAVSVEAP